MAVIYSPSRLGGFCVPLLVYSIANSINAGGEGHEDLHLHTTNSGLIPGSPAIPYPGVMEVGGFFDDEYVRGIMKADLSEISTYAQQAMLVFYVFNATATNPITNGGLFGQTAFDGDMNLVRFTPDQNIEDTADFSEAAYEIIEEINVSTPAVGTKFAVDVTESYNSSIGSRIGFRLQDVFANANAAAAESRGAIAFENVCLEITPQLTVNPLGINLALPSDAEWANPLVDSGEIHSFYKNNATGGTISDTTGFPTAGETKITIQVREGQKYKQGTYDIVTTGTGSGPASFTVAASQASQDLTFNGQINTLSVKKADDTGTYKDTFAKRIGTSDAIRIMEAWRINEDGGASAAAYDNSHPFVRVRDTGTNTFYHRSLTPTRLADMAMTYKKDLWICLHHRVTNAVVTSIATDFQNHATFNRKIYFEFSNEIWNNSFPQGGVLESEAIASGNYGGAPGDSARRQAYYADRTHTLGGLFRTTYANTDIVISSQLDVPNFGNNWVDYSVTDLSNIDAVAVAPYVGGPPSRALDQAAALSQTDATAAALAQSDFDTRVQPNLLTWKTFADTQGWDFLAYEAGPHLDNSDSTAQDHLSTLCHSTEMGDVMENVMAYWFDTLNAGLFCFFQDVGPPTEPWSYHLGELDSTPGARWAKHKLRAR